MARHPKDPRNPIRRGGFTRLQSSLHVTARQVCSPCIGQDFYSRAFTPFVAIGSVEYNYAGIQSIPAAGLSPARHAALWAANKTNPIRPTRRKFEGTKPISARFQPRRMENSRARAENMREGANLLFKDFKELESLISEHLSARKRGFGSCVPEERFRGTEPWLVSMVGAIASGGSTTTGGSGSGLRPPSHRDYGKPRCS